jgi:hypothetical protein
MEPRASKSHQTMNRQSDIGTKKKFIQTSAFGIPECEMKLGGKYKPRISHE